MKGALIYLGIALAISAIFNNVWIFLVAVGLLIVFLLLGILGVFTLPGGGSSNRTNTSDNKDPPSFVMFDDLDDI